MVHEVPKILEASHFQGRRHVGTLGSLNFSHNVLSNRIHQEHY